MNLYFDEDAQKILSEAKREMYELKHPYVGSEHLLLAILKNKDLDITKILNSYGINYEVFKSELIRVVGVGSKCNEWFLFTPLLKRVLNNATYYSKDENKNVSPYSLFISILQEGDGVANRILLGMNIDLELLYDKFVSGDNLVLNRNKKLLLDDFAVNMNEECLKNKYDPVVGRDKQIERVIQILLRKNKNNPLLIGEAGVGKTAIVEELARRITCGNVPFKLKDKIIYNVSMSGLISGTKYRGEFEERLNKIINDIKNDSRIILFIDEVHTLVGAGGAEGAIDASNILKPYLARGDIKVIGATTIDEYTKCIEKDKALERRFQKVYVEEPSLEEVKDIIVKLVPIYEKFHNVCLNSELVDLIIKLSNKYIRGGRQPDKAIDFLDEVCCYVSVNNNKNDVVMADYEEKISAIEEKKNIEILNHNFKKALVLRNEEFSLKDEYNKLLFMNYDLKKEISVTADDIFTVLYNKTSIPLNKILVKKMNGLATKLKKEVFGQDAAIELFVKDLSKINYIDKKCSSIFLLTGKKGVGKTFLIEKVVENVFQKSNLVRLDLSEYGNEHSLTKIVGSAPGYVGYNDRGSFLEKIKEKSFVLVLLENVDQCCLKIFNFFITAFENGYFTNSKGEKIEIGNALFFLTMNVNNSNLGFVEKESGNNRIDLILRLGANLISLKAIDDKVIKRYLEKKVKKYHSLEYSKDLADKIIEESDYKNLGFEKVNYLFDQYFLMMGVK